MKKYLALFLLCCTTLAKAEQSATAQQLQQEGPQVLPKSLLSQLHKVPSNTIITEVIELSGNSAIVTANVADNRCTFDMTKAPNGVESPGGWLVGGMVCDSKTTHKPNRD